MGSVQPDPYVIVRYGQERVTSPVVVKSWEPKWGAQEPGGGGAADLGQARLETEIWSSSRAFGRERVEIVLWDKDKQYLKQYMGEVSIDLMGVLRDMEEGREMAFDDVENKVRSPHLISRKCTGH